MSSILIIQPRRGFPPCLAESRIKPNAMNVTTKLLLNAAKVAGLLLWAGIFYYFELFYVFGYVLAAVMDFLKLVLCY